MLRKSGFDEMYIFSELLKAFPEHMGMVLEQLEEQLDARLRDGQVFDIGSARE